MSPATRVVYTAHNELDAIVLRDHLREAGIRAEVINGQIANGRGVDMVGWPTAARVIVQEMQWAEARVLAEQFDHEQREPGPSADASDEAVPSATWPLCPKCSARRTARCPHCAATSTRFPAADPPMVLGAESSAAAIDIFAPENGASGCGCGPGGCNTAFPAGDADGRGLLRGDSPTPDEPPSTDVPDSTPLLMCSTCDEPFVPVYLHRCEWCGHAFTDGVEAPAVSSMADALNPRLIFGLVAMGGFALAAWAYFAFLLRK